MNKIYPTGKFHPIDSEGFIQNSGMYPLLQKEYQEPLDLNTKLLVEKYSDIIHSIYIRGSVAKGIAAHNVSDIDTIIVSKRKLTESENQFRREIDSKICAEYPFINGVENHFFTIENLSINYVQFLLKTQCTCIYGEDLNPSLPNFKIDKNAIAHAFTLKRDIEESKNDGHSCEWIMKRMVRVGFELCMISAQKYTRDLYLCYEVFSEFYPEKKDKMFEALTLAIFPIRDAKKVDSILDDLGQFLVNEVEIQLSPLD